MIEIRFQKEIKRALAYDEKKIIGECKFVELDDTWNIIHTKVNKSYQGQGIAKKLVFEVIKNAKENSKNIVAECSYADKILKNSTK